MDEKQEYRLRRKAVRMRLRDSAAHKILAKVHRSRAWLSKWQKRFEQQGISGLHSRSRRPVHTSAIYSPRMRQLIVQTRRRLVKQKVGLIGARAIRREVRKVSGDKSLPSLSTIKRVLRQRGLLAQPHQTKRVYFPKPLQVVSGSLHALDWTCRYLEDGPKIYAFHTLNLHTRACTQTIATDKNYETVRAHSLYTWKFPWNPAVFATRQRCRLLRWLQSAAHLRAVRSVVFVVGHRTYLPADRSTRTQWRSRRIEWLVGARLLGTQTLHLLGSGLSHQSDLHPLVYDRVRTAVLGRRHTSTSPTACKHLSFGYQTDPASARSLADYGWTDPFHSPGQAGWHYHPPQ